MGDIGAYRLSAAPITEAFSGTTADGPVFPGTEPGPFLPGSLLISLTTLAGG
jgi:hypothetical protein